MGDVNHWDIYQPLMIHPEKYPDMNHSMMMIERKLYGCSMISIYISRNLSLLETVIIYPDGATPAVEQTGTTLAAFSYFSHPSKMGLRSWGYPLLKL